LKRMFYPLNFPPFIQAAMHPMTLDAAPVA